MLLLEVAIELVEDVDRVAGVAEEELMFGHILYELGVERAIHIRHLIWSEGIKSTLIAMAMAVAVAGSRGRVSRRVASRRGRHMITRGHG